MITLHHLNKSRSKRIIWLLEELELEYEIKPYLRDSVSFFAPPELKSIHPLFPFPPFLVSVSLYFTTLSLGPRALFHVASLKFRSGIPCPWNF